MSAPRDRSRSAPPPRAGGGRRACPAAGSTRTRRRGRRPGTRTRTRRRRSAPEPPSATRRRARTLAPRTRSQAAGRRSRSSRRRPLAPDVAGLAGPTLAGLAGSRSPCRVSSALAPLGASPIPTSPPPACSIPASAPPLSPSQEWAPTSNRSLATMAGSRPTSRCSRACTPASRRARPISLSTSAGTVNTVAVVASSRSGQSSGVESQTRPVSSSRRRNPVTLLLIRVGPNVIRPPPSRRSRWIDPGRTSTSDQRLSQVTGSGGVDVSLQRLGVHPVTQEGLALMHVDRTGMHHQVRPRRCDRAEHPASRLLDDVEVASIRGAQVDAGRPLAVVRSSTSRRAVGAASRARSAGTPATRCWRRTSARRPAARAAPAPPPQAEVRAPLGSPDPAQLPRAAGRTGPRDGRAGYASSGCGRAISSTSAEPPRRPARPACCQNAARLPG